MIGLYTHCNLLLGGKNKLTKVARGALTRANSTSTLFLAVFWAQTSALAQVSVLI